MTVSSSSSPYFVQASAEAEEGGSVTLLPAVRRGGGGGGCRQLSRAQLVLRRLILRGGRPTEKATGNNGVGSDSRKS